MPVPSPISEVPEATSLTRPSSLVASEETGPASLSRTVTFDNLHGPAHRTTDERLPRAPASPIPSTDKRHSTQQSRASRASSKLEPQWRKQTVLSFGKLCILQRVCQCFPTFCLSDIFYFRIGRYDMHMCN